AAPVEQLDNRLVAHRGDVVVADRRLEKLLEIAAADDGGQTPLALRRRQPTGRIGGDGARALQPPEVAAQGRRPSSGRPAAPTGRGDEGEVAPQEDPVDGLGALEAAPLGPRAEVLEVTPVGGNRVG